MAISHFLRRTPASSDLTEVHDAHQRLADLLEFGNYATSCHSREATNLYSQEFHQFHLILESLSVGKHASYEA